MSVLRNENNDMIWSEHLLELRKRVIRVLLLFVAVFIITFNYVPGLLEFIKGSINYIQVDLNVFNITDPLMLYVKLAALISFIISFPYLILELWWFVKSGLTRDEARYMTKYIPFIVVFFFLGVIFAYKVMLPYYVVFSNKLAGAASLELVMGAQQYIEFLTKMLIYFGLVFQLPVLVSILARIGLIESKMMTAIRRYAYLGLMIVAAFMTPPDPMSMGIALIPLISLYEMSIGICKLIERKK